MSDRKIFWCNHCLNISTRPRITFDHRGWCNACQWMEEKKQLNWHAREKEFQLLADQCKTHNDMFNCIVPVSGGKDGSYVSYILKHKYHLNVLAVTVKPALSLDIGNTNLNNFIEAGYHHIQISPNMKVIQKLNKYGFIEKGFPYYGWLIAIMTSVIQLAVKFDIPLIVYGEDGEVEYGGSTENKNRATYDIDYMKRVYLEGGYTRVLQKIRENEKISEKELAWFTFPEHIDNLKFTHWSYFESWDSYRNYIIAKEHCGLTEKEKGNTDTFTNFAQNDQALYSLHAYLMYLKFGFGRATQDAGIEIRRGAMTRDQAINLVQMYDNAYPHEYINTYLQYYKMSKEEFDAVLDKYANKDLFEKQRGIWQPKFTVGTPFFIRDTVTA
ncbi:MAG: legionaminic acid biosynthesis protein PtmG [Gammaproteobacteria bacterium RIFCSPHIGHO2_12_FULL_38_14]|nr:MAG: legionaminic acid biosynthesis protein PtmG [Gammaproteobacteria bacterium RIFCSPHIGHO2_12_FULL_38_14]